MYKKIEKPARKLLVIPIGNKNIRNANSIQKKNTPVCWYNENKASKVYQSKEKKIKIWFDIKDLPHFDCVSVDHGKQIGK